MHRRLSETEDYHTPARKGFPFTRKHRHYPTYRQLLQLSIYVYMCNAAYINGGGEGGGEGNDYITPNMKLIHMDG